MRACEYHIGSFDVGVTTGWPSGRRTRAAVAVCWNCDRDRWRAPAGANGVPFLGSVASTEQLVKVRQVANDTRFRIAQLQRLLPFHNKKLRRPGRAGAVRKSRRLARGGVVA
jgi:hypothetical protein